MRRKFWILIAGTVLVVGVIASGVGDIYVSGKWRYKMTVVVETPEGIKTGSAVREVRNTMSSLALDLPDAGNPAEFKGEAVAVDLGERGVLFALLKQDGGYADHARNIVHDVFPYSGGYSTAAGIRHYDSLKGGKVALTVDQYPMLVTFRDLNDPKTVTRVLDFERFGKKVPPEQRIKADHFEDIFGKGVKLKEITIEMTDEPVTWKIESLLPWLKSLETTLSGSKIVTSASLANNLGVGSFKIGE